MLQPLSTVIFSMLLTFKVAIFLTHPINPLPYWILLIIQMILLSLLISQPFTQTPSVIVSLNALFLFKLPLTYLNPHSCPLQVPFKGPPLLQSILPILEYSVIFQSSIKVLDLKGFRIVNFKR